MRRAQVIIQYALIASVIAHWLSVVVEAFAPQTITRFIGFERMALVVFGLALALFLLDCRNSSLEIEPRRQ